MPEDRRFERYRFLQSYVGWTSEDERRIRHVARLLGPHLPSQIDEFYAEIEKHPEVRSVITGGPEQIGRLKASLLGWLNELLSGCYNEPYVDRRWRVGLRHVEIGLNQIYTNAALSRLRVGLLRALGDEWSEGAPELMEMSLSLTKLLDLDLAIIEDAYQYEASARLKRTERLATMGQVAGSVAHEVRNPLNVVKTSVYFLLNAQDPSPEKISEHLRRIDRHVALADSVITTLTSFARMPMPRILPVSAERCLSEALELNEIGSGVRVEIDFPPNLPLVLADVNQLRIVFGNLIRNANDAMAHGGRLSIEGRLIGDEVAVEIADSGTGISAEILARIMEPLYTTKARGLGLGLAIVRAILDQVEGHLNVVSEPGLGSRFTVRLKAAPSEKGAK
ncbi:protoglobin domain-containing protein [Tundrisphaera lichenicola]|uniref:protoglobin domain-containing protein n=1 Tax=Tundrisphaera lichenicola TaxID=2029860 RepID=UPI003EBCBBDD